MATPHVIITRVLSPDDKELAVQYNGLGNLILAPFDPKNIPKNLQVSSILCYITGLAAYLILHHSLAVVDKPDWEDHCGSLAQSRPASYSERQLRHCNYSGGASTLDIRQGASPLWRNNVGFPLHFPALNKTNEAFKFKY
jgi:hypothetical protein